MSRFSICLTPVNGYDIPGLVIQACLPQAMDLRPRIGKKQPGRE